ncbi:S-adenosylmethionine decarboxylase [Patescibacteria group bacterium]|nr:S-adenosylmethionine decarboxylase [Patescibacteria group bacterium]
MNVTHRVYEFDTEIRDIKVCVEFLLELTNTIKTTPVNFNASLYPTPDKKGGVGITAVVQFAESYAVLDSWPEKNYVHLNVVSCKHFDSLISFIQNWFGISKVKEHTIQEHEK